MAKVLQRTIEDKHKISPFLIFFTVHSSQIGVGILGFQRKLVETSGNDSWMVVIFAGFMINLILWMIYQIMMRSEGDLIVIHADLAGRWIGGLLSLIWILYFLIGATVVLRAYIEIIQVWMFSDISVFWLGLLLLIVVYYAVSGGFRTVAGVCFLGVLIPLYLSLTFLFPLEFAQYRNILPIWNHSPGEMILSSNQMVMSYLGFSTLMMYYPYIRQPKKSQAWAHAGNMWTMLAYTALMLLSLFFFSEPQLVKNNWATLTLWKIVEMPFVERFEYIGISSWVLVILPNLCLSYWAASRGLNQLLGVKQNRALICVLLIGLVVTALLRSRESIDMVVQYMSQAALFLIAGYIPLLLVCTYIFKKKRRST